MVGRTNRTGKSRTLWERFGNNRYLKGITKWWDNYRYEETVIIEEADPLRCQHMAHYFKIWCDHYPFRAEVKCTSQLHSPKQDHCDLQLHHKRVFPTNKTTSPLERRFKIVTFSGFKPPSEPIQQPAFANGWNAPFDFDPNALGKTLEDL